MSLLQTYFRKGYITDLVCPPPPPGKTAADVLQTGHSIAMSMVSSAETMAFLNPFVTDVGTLPANDPEAVDVSSLAASFKVELNSAHATSAFTQYTITDKLPVLFNYSTTMVYHSAMRTTTTGLEALTDPGSGVTIHGHWTVRVAQPGQDGNTTRHDEMGQAGREIETETEAEGAPAADDDFSLTNSSGVINFVETQQTRCSVLLAWYIKQSFDKSHRTTHRRFKEMWRERMKKELYPTRG